MRQNCSLCCDFSKINVSDQLGLCFWYNFKVCTCISLGELNLQPVTCDLSSPLSSVQDIWWRDRWLVFLASRFYILCWQLPALFSSFAVSFKPTWVASAFAVLGVSGPKNLNHIRAWPALLPLRCICMQAAKEESGVCTLLSSYSLLGVRERIVAAGEPWNWKLQEELQFHCRQKVDLQGFVDGYFSGNPNISAAWRGSREPCRNLRWIEGSVAQ